MHEEDQYDNSFDEQASNDMNTAEAPRPQWEMFLDESQQVHFSVITPDDAMMAHLVHARHLRRKKTTLGMSAWSQRGQRV